METPDKTPVETPPVEAPATEAVPEIEQLPWKEWLIKGGVVAIVVLAVVLYKAHRQSGNEQASRMLGEARNVQALQAIITQYPSSPAARLALLQTAKAHYDAGDFMAASSMYGDFVKKYPKHPMVDIAEMGKIQCMEAMGKLPEALTAYSAFAMTRTNSFLAPVAVFGKARCLEQSGRRDEARTLYEDFLAANPKSQWKQEVEENLRQIERDARKPGVRL
jgi:outer membrane protein assembly factor BamD (BamD/ComL family)